MDEPAFQLDAVGDDLVRIALAKPPGLPEAASQPNNVYLLDGPAPALIGAGHPSQFRSLCEALRQAGAAASTIERVVYPSWQIDVLGGATNFPQADHFVLSPDMVEPLDYESAIDARRQRIRALGERVVEVEQRFDTGALERLEGFLERYYPRMPARLRFAPMRGGHSVAAGRCRFEVIATPGPHPGHLALYDAQAGLLFSGSFSLRGMPDQLDAVQPYLVSLERLLDIEADWVLPTYGRAEQDSRWVLHRAHAFLNNFMSNAAMAMPSSPTAIEFIEADRGRPIDDLAELVLLLGQYLPPLDELVRARMIDAEGDGLTRRYGVDVDDPRGQVRPS